MSNLKLTRFGNPILREVARELSVTEIKSGEIQQLITDMRKLNEAKQYGVGLAAPQVGRSVALALIGIKPTPTRPDIEPFETVIINPKFKGVGKLTSMWEGCMSCGGGEDILYGQTRRYEEVEAEWLNENAEAMSQTLTGLVAQVFQHETDHLNGVLFVDRVIDNSTFIMADEYHQRIQGGTHA